MIVPTTFIGGRRYHVRNYQDAMAICRMYGPPEIFVTFTCSTKWRKIKDALRFEPGQQPCDRSDMIVRGFNMKLDEFITDIREGTTFGSAKDAIENKSAPHKAADIPDNVSTSTQKSVSNKRTRASSGKEAVKKLFAGEDIMDDNGHRSADSVVVAAQPSVAKYN